MDVKISRRVRLKQEQRAAILRAAREILHEEGVAALNMRAVGTRIEYSQSVIYAHFAGKAELLMELAQEGQERLSNAMAVAIAETTEGSWAVKVRALGRVYRQFAVEFPDLFGLLFGEVDSAYRPKGLDPALTFGQLAATVEGGVRAGEFQAAVARYGATVAWALVHGVVALERAGGLPAGEAPAVLEQAMDDLLRGWEVLKS